MRTLKLLSIITAGLIVVVYSHLEVYALGQINGRTEVCRDVKFMVLQASKSDSNGIITANWITTYLKIDNTFKNRREIIDLLGK
jgi:hypothetical protein